MVFRLTVIAATCLLVMILHLQKQETQAETTCEVGHSLDLCMYSMR